MCAEIAEKMIDDMNERHGCTVSGMKDSLLKRLEEYSGREMCVSCGTPSNGQRFWRGRECWGSSICRHSSGAGISPLGRKRQHASGNHAAAIAEANSSREVKRYIEDQNTVRVEVGTTVDEAERQLILKTLSSTHNNKTKAAEILGISSKTLQNKLKEYRALLLRRRSKRCV